MCVCVCARAYVRLQCSVRQDVHNHARTHPPKSGHALGHVALRHELDLYYTVDKLEHGILVRAAYNDTEGSKRYVDEWA